MSSTSGPLTMPPPSPPAQMAASDEFRKRAVDPVTEDTVFQIWSRIGLRTALEAYPVFDKKSLKQMMSHTGGGSTSMR